MINENSLMTSTADEGGEDQQGEAGPEQGPQGLGIKSWGFFSALQRVSRSHQVSISADILACSLDLNFKVSELKRLNFKQVKLMLTLLNFKETILPLFFVLAGLVV